MPLGLVLRLRRDGQDGAVHGVRGSWWPAGEPLPEDLPNKLAMQRSSESVKTGAVFSLLHTHEKVLDGPRVRLPPDGHACHHHQQRGLLYARECVLEGRLQQRP